MIYGFQWVCRSRIGYANFKSNRRRYNTLSYLLTAACRSKRIPRRAATFPEPNPGMIKSNSRRGSSERSRRRNVPGRKTVGRKSDNEFRNGFHCGKRSIKHPLRLRHYSGSRSRSCPCNRHRSVRRPVITARQRDIPLR